MTIKKQKKPVAVSISDLDIAFYARKALDQDRVIYFWELLESGEELDPIDITTSKKVIDGRHRIEASVIAGRADIQACYQDDIKSEVELIGKAYRANTGGALPPTKQDTEYVISLLLQRNETTKKIGELLGLPASMARKYVNEVKSKMGRAKLKEAVESVTEGGLTAAKAAEKHSVDLGRLKEMLSGKRKTAKNGVTEIQRNLTSTYRSHSLKNATLMRSLIAMYEDGDVSAKQVNDIIAHVKSLQERATRVVNDWACRFEAANKKS